ncbi:MAG: hypothetical protein GEV03_00140 [Streptosporangiales bacterium]|nr:hypothetical protein [Streptosporangiales bacterium]
MAAVSDAREPSAGNKRGEYPASGRRSEQKNTERKDDRVLRPAESDRDRRRRRAIFLRELAEARELRKRVAPRRSRRARIHEALRMRTFRL